MARLGGRGLGCMSSRCEAAISLEATRVRRAKYGSRIRRGAEQAYPLRVAWAEVFPQSTGVSEPRCGH